MDWPKPRAEKVNLRFIIDLVLTSFGAGIVAYVVYKVKRSGSLERENRLLKMSKELSNAKKDIDSVDLTKLVDLANESARKRRDAKQRGKGSI